MNLQKLSNSQINLIEQCDIQLFTCAMQENNIDQITVKNFQYIINNYFNQFGRIFAWRQTTNPYHIVVSEIMLQQTQTYRVQGKFEQFIDQFPNFETVAHATVAEVIAAWQGLGYNRRALALHKIAQCVIQEFDGNLPADPQILATFPSIGCATASSICAFAFNMPTIFIETNIRTVFIHFFFHGSKEIKDTQIMPLIEKTLDHQNPRLWYYALMDFGVALKKLYLNPSRKSAHYTKQSKFEGSNRQIRGLILKLLVQYSCLSQKELLALIKREPERILLVVQELLHDGFIVQHDDTIRLK